jgi:hypothetical protein
MYKKYFSKILREDGSNYTAATPNTAGAGGALGNSPTMYTGTNAGGTPGTDSYAPGDYRIPTSVFGGKIMRRNISTKKKKKKSKK